MSKKENKKQRGYILALILLAVCIFIGIADKTPDLTQTSSAPQSSISETVPELHGLYNVVRVVDGDTIVVDIDGENTKIRFIGVDTPESVNPDVSRNTENGKIASAWTTELLTDKQIYLEYDKERTDKYGRTLAYVYLDDKRTMMQNELLKNGLAEVMTIAPNRKYADSFKKLEAEARNNKIGFWSE